MVSLLAVPVFKAVETAFNSYLSLDSAAPAYQRQLLGKVIQIDVSGPGIEMYFIFSDQRVEVCHEFGADADVVIRGTPVSLMAVATGRVGLMQSGIAIEGEVDIAHRFSQLLERIDIDWEEHVASVAGDKPAHLLGRIKNGASNWAIKFQSDLERNVADYLRDETRHLPHQWELDEFIDEIDTLRDRVDRLLRKAQVMDDHQL